jgi:hypothetical protein
MSGALFASLPFPGAPASPGHSINFKEHEKIMRAHQTSGHWNQHIGKLRKKWIDFTNGVVRAIAKELAHIRREELRELRRAHNQREQSREASQQ